MNDTMMTRWGTALAARLVADSKERGVALLSAIFFMVLVAGLSVVLLSAILSQAAPSFNAQKSTRTVYAAQAGLQSALGLIRTADAVADPAGDIFGDPGKLPCAVAGSVTGTEDEAEGATYDVRVQYFSEDPTEKNEAWRDDNKIACVPETGVPEVPKYAFIYSAGEDTALPGHADASDGDRYLSAVYKFKVSNVNISGGEIYTAGGDRCLRAVAAVAGALIELAPRGDCLEDDLHLWVFGPDYQLKLASTTAKDKTPLCITGPVNDEEDTQDATLQVCAPSGSDARWNQLWSWTGAYTWSGQQKSITGGPSGYCLRHGAAKGGGRLFLEVNNGCHGGGTFAPSASVGAGAAGYGTYQIVNYKEFGRCADVTAEQIGSSFMIVYPCKQDPSGGTGVDKILWNHKWHYSEPPDGVPSTEPQEIYVNYKDKSGQRFCLTAPSAGLNGDLIFLTCEDRADQKWIRVGDTGEYASSYLFIDFDNRCMVADPSEPYDTYYSRVRVETCREAALEQKWNAPPTYVESTFGGYREVAP